LHFSLPIHLYLVDTFTHAASALSAASVRLLAVFYPAIVCAESAVNRRMQVSRSLLAFAFPLFGAQMFRALGLGVGNSLLAVLAIVMGVPFPIFIWFYGERLRARSSMMK
jgi:hypothetical protein